MKDFYYILGVNSESTLLEIIEAYEKLSPKFDPVLNGHDSFYTKQFNEIREAFHVLTDPAKRKLYDEQLKALNISTPAIKQKKSLTGSVTPKIDIIFSLILILLTGIFGSYVYRSVYQNNKKLPVVSQPLISTPPVTPLVIRHKQKRHIKHKTQWVTKTNDDIEQPVTVAAIPAKASAPVSYPVVKTSALINNAVIQSPLSVKPYTVSKPTVTSRTETITEEDLLNEAVVRTNETGVVYLREYAQFRAPVIKTLQDRAKIIILEKGSKYYKVQSDELIGFIPKWAVKLNEQE